MVIEVETSIITAAGGAPLKYPSQVLSL